MYNTFTVFHFINDFLPADRRKFNQSRKKLATSITSINYMFFKNTIR